MSTPKVHVVWAHPRPDSVTAVIVADVIAALEAAGAEVDALDLYRAGFDPALREPDEPDWDDLDREYSPEVMRLADRARAADALVILFPVWWFSLPAVLKGYVDRVWNHGLFYGGGRDPGIAAVRWIGVAGDPASKFRARGMDELMAHHLNVGIAGYCGIPDSELVLLHDTLGTEATDSAEHAECLRDDARSCARALVAHLGGQPGGRERD